MLEKTLRELLGRGRRLSLVRLVTTALAALFGVQAATAAVLMAIASQRKRRRPDEGFPHLSLPPVQVGENELRLYSYGRDLYDAMLTAVDSAQETIFLETFIWKGDALGEEFKCHLARKAREGVAVYAVFDGFGNLVVPSKFKRFPPEIHTMKYSAI